MELETKRSQHSRGLTDHHQLAASTLVVFIAAMKRFLKLFLNGIYCMTRIFNTDTVYEMLFNCVSVWCLACLPLGAVPVRLQDMKAYLLVIAHFHLL